jgi:uncharacterized protein (DUF697 family)
MASESQKTSAHVIIHSSAIAAATWSGGWAILPGAGVIGDTAGNIVITAAMAYALGNVFNRKTQESSIMAFVTIVLRQGLVQVVVKGVLSFIPILGSASNATISFTTMEVIGWSLFLIYDAGKDPGSLSKEEIASFLQRGKTYAEEVKRSGKYAWLDDLPPHIKVQYDYLTKKLSDRNLSNEERQATLKEIEELIAPYNPEKSKG